MSTTTQKRLTKKEYYDLLCKAAADGTFPSMYKKRCMYRGDDGKKCAVGLLISDELYREHENIEYSQVIELPEPLINLILPEGMTLEQLNTVQLTHDTLATSGKGWDTELFLKRLQRLDCFKDLHSPEATKADRSHVTEPQNT